MHLVEAGAVERAAHEEVATVQAVDLRKLEAHLRNDLGHQRQDRQRWRHHERDQGKRVNDACYQ